MVLSINLSTLIKVGCRCFATALVISMLGCATRLSNEQMGLSIASLGLPRVLLMQTQLIRGSDSYTMDMIVEVTPKQLIVVGSALGVRVFTLSYDGKNIVNGPGLGLPFYISNQLIVDDLMVILSESQSFDAKLPEGFTIIRGPGLRNIYEGDQLILSVTESKAINGNTDISLRRTNPKYALNIVMSEVR